MTSSSGWHGRLLNLHSIPSSYHSHADAWWGFTSAVNRQRFETVLRRGKWSGLCSRDLPTIAELVDYADEVLFSVQQSSGQSVPRSAQFNAK